LERWIESLQLRFQQPHQRNGSNRIGYGSGVAGNDDVDGESVGGPVLGGAVGYVMLAEPSWALALEGEFLTAFLGSEDGGVSTSTTWLSPGLNLVFTLRSPSAR
jgi:hypothetical protein